MRNAFAIALFVLALGIAGRASAGIVLEIQMFETQLAPLEAAAAVQAAGNRVPEGARLVLSVEALAELDRPFLARTTLGARTIEVQGQIHPIADGNYRVAYAFSDKTTNTDGTVNTRSWKSNLMLPMGQQKLASGGPGTMSFIQLKPEPAK